MSGRKWLFSVPPPMPYTLTWGVYACIECGADYNVNRADTWDRCTPTTCHDCTRKFDEFMAKAKGT